MIMNAKGGCGKTTLATNLACWFADQDGKVALAAGTFYLLYLAIFQHQKHLIHYT